MDDVFIRPLRPFGRRRLYRRWFGYREAVRPSEKYFRFGGVFSDGLGLFGG
ncbi:hypothetical protein NEIELOOT_00191 [Neisseria elongata subsp. glycolytica ATCC 29315]|uniref:Uncharacterized protein n=1 Tax=Neisseria elongata subsp. glycolytica ATCC 29315 TaxID=546263 RepID=D4DMC4_NEIEG|nr:hypothetical protein NEIELOOT_00191 [Neisseria elongata subsp. glycolytica ATCC 29315]